MCQLLDMPKFGHSVKVKRCVKKYATNSYDFGSLLAICHYQ